MADLIRGLDAGRIRENVAAVRSEIAAACRTSGRDPSTVELVAATKYVAVEDLGVLAEAGLTLLGENRMQDLVAKHAAWPGRFTFDFIGHLQSRKVADVAPLVRCIHSVCSDSVLARLEQIGDRAPGLRVLVEVNIAGEPDKSGIALAELERFLERCPVPVDGLMTMPPATSDAHESRPWFGALAALARAHDLAHLSMGTTQDFAIAVEEGATIVRVGSRLFR